jgi:hypothetical protein
LYFVKRNKQDPEESEVLSLCKLKTLEYRLFRKMREKLRNFHGDKNGNRTDERVKYVTGKFVSEAK